MVMPRMPGPAGLGSKLHVPPLQAHRFRLRIKRGAEVEELVPDVAKQFGVTEEEARVYLKQLQSERAQVGGGPGRLQSQQGHPRTPGNVANKTSIPTSDQERVARLQGDVQRLVDTGNGDVVRILREIEELRNEIETGPTGTKATRARGEVQQGVAQDDANPAANVSRPEEIAPLLATLDEIEGEVLQGRSPREAVDAYGQGPPPPTEAAAPAPSPAPRDPSSPVFDLKAGTPFEPGADINGLQGEFAEYPGRLFEPREGQAGRFSTTELFPVLEVRVPEYAPDGSITTKTKMLTGDIYTNHPNAADPKGPMIVMGDKRYLFDTDTNTFRLLSEGEYNQMAADYLPRPSGTPQTTQAVLNQNKINTTSAKDLANVPMQPGPPAAARIRTLRDSGTTAKPSIVPGDRISDPSVNKTLEPTPGLLSGGRRPLSEDQGRAAAGALTEFFSRRRLNADRGTGVLEALEELDGPLNAKRLSDLGAVDVENIPLDQLQPLLREAEGSRYGADTFAIPEADMSERHLLQAQVEEATRYRDEVKNQLLARGEPLSRRELVDAEAELQSLLEQQAQVSDGPAGMPKILADEFNNVVGEYGKAGVDGYMQVRTNLQERLRAAEARGTQTQVVGGSIAGRNDDAAQLRQALGYMDSTLEPELRKYAGTRFIKRMEGIGNSTQEVGKRLGELRQSGVDLSEQQLHQLQLRVERMDSMLEQLTAAQAKLPEGDPRRKQFQVAIEQVQAARQSLDQQYATSSLAGTERLSDQAASYPSGALDVLNRYFMEDPEGFRKLAESSDFTTRTTGFNLDDGAEVDLATQLDLAAQIEEAIEEVAKAKAAKATIGTGEFTKAGRRVTDPETSSMYIPPDQRSAFTVDEPNQVVVPQASQGTMQGLAAMRAYLESKKARTPLWTKERIAESTNSGLPSQRVLERAGELEAIINDPSTEAGARQQARQELEQILRRERRDVGGERSASEQLAAEQMEFEMGGEGKNPGTLDSGFFYTADTELPAINEMLRGMSSAELPSDKKLLALRQAAAGVGGIEELYIRGYLRMNGGPAVEKEYAKLADASRNNLLEAERMRVDLERAAEAYGFPSAEALVAKARQSGIIGGSTDLARRVQGAQEMADRMSQSGAALKADADSFLSEHAPGVREQVQDQVGQLSATQVSPRSLEQQIAAVDKELSLNPSREHTKDLLKKKKALEFRLRQKQGALKRADWDRFLAGTGISGLDPVQDSQLLRILHGMHEAGNLEPGMRPQIEYLIRTSGSDPAKQEAVLKYIKKNTETKPIEASSNPDLFAENYNADPANYEEIQGGEMDSILQDIEGMQDRYQWAENTLLELDADGMDFDETKLNASDRRRFQEAQAFIADYDDDMDNLEGQLETAAKNYAPQWTQVRADLSSLRQGDFDPSTAREITGRPFYAQGGAANEAALFGAASRRFRRGDFLSDNSGLGGRTLEDIRKSADETEAQLRDTLGLDLSDDTPVIEYATTRLNELNRTIQGAQTGGRNLGEVARSFRERDNLAAQTKAYQDAQKTLAAVEGEEFSVLEPTVKTYEVDDAGNGFAIIEVPETLASGDTGGRPTNAKYTLKVPISFDDTFRGDLSGRRIEMLPADGGGFEGTLTELRNGERGDVDWATGEQRAKRFRTRMGKRQKLHLRNIEEAANAQRAARTQPAPETQGPPSPPVSEGVVVKDLPEMKLDGPGRIRKALGYGSTAMKIGGGVATGGAIAAWAADQMNKAAQAPTEEEKAAEDARIRRLLGDQNPTPADNNSQSPRLTDEELLRRVRN